MTLYAETRVFATDHPLIPAPRPKTLSHSTSLALCFSFALLALHPDEQERLYQHIKDVMFSDSSLDGVPVSFKDLNLYRDLASR
jgi:hypothetical protein